jgi:peptidoglycan hydrolase-like protein with peptidoglycan-binding domain
MKKQLLLLLLCSAPSFWLPPAPIQAAPKAAVTLKWPTIRPETPKNETGFNADYAAVQYLLRARGFYRAKIDGMYGSKTTAAVKAFQKSRKLRVDGVAGPQTLPLLVIKIKRGSKGDAVRAAQILVRNMSGINGGTPNLGLEGDGVFGKETERAIRIAQESLNLDANRLKVDGVMGPQSWCLMLGGKAV